MPVKTTQVASPEEAQRARTGLAHKTPLQSTTIIADITINKHQEYPSDTEMATPLSRHMRNKKQLHYSPYRNNRGKQCNRHRCRWNRQIKIKVSVQMPDLPTHLNSMTFIFCSFVQFSFSKSVLVHVRLKHNLLATLYSPCPAFVDYIHFY